MPRQVKDDRKQPNRTGRNIAALRRYWFLSQTALGNEIGLSRQQVSRIETGRTQLKAEHLPAIAALLRCLPEELVNGDYAEMD